MVRIDFFHIFTAETQSTLLSTPKCHESLSTNGKVPRLANSVISADSLVDAAPAKGKRVKQRVVVKAETGSASSADTIEHRLGEIAAEAPPAASQVVVKQEHVDGENCVTHTFKSSTLVRIMNI